MTEKEIELSAHGVKSPTSFLERSFSNALLYKIVVIKLFRQTALKSKLIMRRQLIRAGH